MSSNEELISKFKDVTGVADDRAKFYLESANFQLQLALSSFYEGEHEVDIAGEAEQPNANDLKFSSNASSFTTSGNQTDSDNDTGFKNSSVKNRIATLHDMSKRPSDDEDEQGQAFYAGGSERSGQQVLGPPKRKNFREQLTEMFRMAHESGGPDNNQPTPSTSRADLYQGHGLRLGQTTSDHALVSGISRQNRPLNIEPVVLKLWSQGFSINDGELRLYDVPDNREFLESVMKGQIPNELRQMGSMVSVDLEDHRHEDYKKPVTKVKTFKGSGHTLGSPAPNVQASVLLPASAITNTEETRKRSAEQLIVNSNEPTTMIQIRLDDGTRLSAQFNHSHTINDIRDYIISSRPQYENQHFVLVTAFPTKELSDGTQTIENAGLLNASLMQRLK